MKPIVGSGHRDRGRISTPKITFSALAVCLAILFVSWPRLWAGPSDPVPPVPQFDRANFGSTPYVITNPFLPMAPGTSKIYEADTTEGFEPTVVTVEQATRVVLGIECRVAVGRAYLDGDLIEEEFDWFAQDLAGNVWYFGEESRTTEGGMVVSTAGSWEAGVDGARPGFVMCASPRVGESYRQEYYAGQAEDTAEVTALNVTVTLRNASY